MTKVIIIVLLAASWGLQSIGGWEPVQLGYYHDCPLANRLWFSLFHANVWHLAVNCYAAWVCLNDRTMPYRVLIPFLLAAAFAASWLSTKTDPTIGASAALCAMMGLNMVWCRNWKYWLLMEVSLLVGFILPSVNAVAHISAFVIGFLAGQAILLYRRLCDDHRAASL